jgi:hypothetical protein
LPAESRGRTSRLFVFQLPAFQQLAGFLDAAADIVSMVDRHYSLAATRNFMAPLAALEMS